MCSYYKEHHLAFLPRLKSGVSTTGGVDNIYHNTSSRSAKDSFHGTAISITQTSNVQCLSVYLEMIGYFNTPWQKIGITFKSTLCHIIILTNFDSFANVQHFVPVIDSNIDVGTDVLHTSLIRERLWLDKVLDVVVNEHYVDDNVSWFAYHALQNTEALAAGMNSINALLHLFHERAYTVAMAFTQCHTLSSSAQKARQTTVVTVDQPLHALAKEIEWLRPDTYGETKFVILMGGLIHIEMAFLCVFRGLAGWWWVVQGYRRVQGHFFWKGWCYDRGEHVTRWAHQVTAAALYAPQRAA